MAKKTTIWKSIRVLFVKLKFLETKNFYWSVSRRRVNLDQDKEILSLQLQIAEWKLKILQADKGKEGKGKNVEAESCGTAVPQSKAPLVMT